MQQIPLQPVPAQNTRAVLGGQNCQLSIYQKARGIFVDVSIDGNAIVSGILALDAVPIVCREYVGFVGNLLFIDTQGNDAPHYAGLGSRWMLVYLTADEYAVV